jgi:hypothetical protein
VTTTTGLIAATKPLPPAELPAGIRTMYDSNTINSVPLTPAPQMVAWYPNTWGVTEKSSNDISRFGSETQILTIDNVGNAPECDILDVETGAATFEQAATWVVAKRNLHKRTPTIYCDVDNLPGLADAIEDLGFVWIWVAEWNGIAHAYGGAFPALNMNLCATQWTSPSSPVNPSAGNYDISYVSNPQWHPVLPPPVVQTSGMIVYETSAGFVAAQATSPDLINWTVTQSL